MIEVQSLDVYLAQNPQVQNFIHGEHNSDRAMMDGLLL